LNLLLCTAYRLATRFKAGARFRIGPDLIHVSLLVMLIGGGVTFINRKEAYVQLREGDAMELPSGDEVLVTELQALTYDDNRPRDWLTEVLVNPSAENPDSHTIEVNRTLRVGGFSVYQDSFGTDGSGSEFVTGLRIVDDPGYTPVFIGLVILCAGLLLTFVQKIADKKQKRGAS
jgi:cytochrome c biogenesis protein